jgi:hypothetical protein
MDEIKQKTIKELDDRWKETKRPIVVGKKGQYCGVGKKE